VEIVRPFKGWNLDFNTGILGCNDGLVNARVVWVGVDFLRRKNDASDLEVERATFVGAVGMGRK
jgi:hypothetical protein